ncbi:hypothetical protein ENUP19_0274G0041 [Entamoeba nuttalli]|uniref:Tyrosine kinase, putative n=2 Tax=Entamoeba nuttalli TaxID=412467 RepID=K2HQU1_ENTNP|nr:tyrosine kinase, putative [Entamoeba nuttalli P19]EKE38325.1 tyrosine kinase, putative [Entamoeba nuttalli P19]|eukprot:XP_008859331.1 tyrosine kinase, putative [Entamoeba nuttalli P19]
MNFIFGALLFIVVFASCDNCKSCEDEKCTDCKSGFMMLGDSCVDGNTVLDHCEEFNTDKFGCKKCARGYSPTLHGLCLKCEHLFGPDCLDCDQTRSDKCTQCRNGAIVTREGACIYCRKYFRQCAECDGMTMRCTKCSNGRKPDNGFC